MPFRPWSNEEVSRLHKLVENGWSLPKAAKILGRTKTATEEKWRRLRQPRKKRFTVPDNLKTWYEKCRRAWGKDEARRLLAQRLKK